MPVRIFHFSFTSAWMAAIIGAATDVPPKPLQVLGAPAHDVPPLPVPVSE